MDDLEGNILYKAFLTKFRREFDIACKMSYVIAIPHSDSLDDVIIDQFLINSHILMPSKLLKMHYTPLQAGNATDVEIDDGNRLIVYFGKTTTKKQQQAVVDEAADNRMIINIIAEEIGYNVYNREFRTILIEKPILAPNAPLNLFRSILSPKISKRSSASLRSLKPPKPLIDHDNCFKYLEYISQEVTTNLELDVKRLQSKYMILSHYLDDAATRIKTLSETYIPKYENSLALWINNGTHQSSSSSLLNCDSIRQLIGTAVENYVVYLLHGKLIAALYNRHEKEDRIMLKKFNEIEKSRLTVCQLGAQSAFSDFILTEEILQKLRRLPSLQSPLAMVSSLMELVNLISESLNQSVRFKDMINRAGEVDGGGGGGGEVRRGSLDKVSICSDDLIASFVYSLAQSKPPNLYSTSKYLETFGFSSNAKEQAAYYTATFQIVIQYVFNYRSDDCETVEQSCMIDGRRHHCELSSQDDKRDTSEQVANRESEERKTGSQHLITKTNFNSSNQNNRFIDSLDSRASTTTEQSSTS